MKIQDILGISAVVGEIIGIVGYIPQLFHLFKTKNSAGMAIGSWIMWAFSNLLALSYAISIVNTYYIIIFSIIFLLDVFTTIMVVVYKPRETSK
ncbi:MAG: PQ-loop repeat-containing protein [Candidatus Berkelbacteria bacterium]|nr:PQ-loop repeat-containing protein [Candidatus Berkelbacteria bacterium]